MDKDTEDRLKIGVREWAVEEARRKTDNGKMTGWVGAEDIVGFATKLETYVIGGIFKKEKD